MTKLQTVEKRKLSYEEKKAYKRKQDKERKKSKKLQWKKKLDGMPDKERIEYLSKLKQDRLDKENKRKKNKETLEEMYKDFDKSAKEKICVLIDTAYDEKMNEKEIKSMTQQLMRCYAVNRKMENPLLLGITNLDKRLREKMKELFPEFFSLPIMVTEKPLMEAFSSTKIIYLTPESENLLSDFKPGVCYCIGGMIDKNRHSGLCESRAKKLGLETARLPIKEVITDLNSSTVITVNHCFEIMSKYVQNGHDLSKAITEIFPTRKRKGSNAD